MSAWLDVVNRDGSDEWLAVCSAALVEVKRETLRQAAARLHKRLDDLPAIAMAEDDALIRGLYEAIDIILDWRSEL